ncbi:hypothetical protein TcWFU_010178 [Taenia crassiceps]|uniref:Calmodulin-lysine N-methyltransferase n=1 Tax=Taenia crassiceps TaxID=6207 RepID=A0ABR4Q3S4_9CEST
MKRDDATNLSLNCLSSANVFGLFKISCIEETPMAVVWRLSPRTSSASQSPPPTLLLGIPKPFSRSRNIEDLVGFDRTGVAVLLWPCELLLAYIFLNPPGALQHIQFPPTCRRAVELAAGSLGLGGLAMSATCSELEYLLLTDGNEECVRNLEGVLKASPRNGGPRVEAAFLRWSESIDKEPQPPEGYEDWRHSFDLVIAADCFFTFHTSSTHGGLLCCIDYLLSACSGSTFLALAPQRGATLGNFVDLASSFEVCERFHWKVCLLQPSVVFPGLTGDPEKMIPHLVCIQRWDLDPWKVSSCLIRILQLKWGSLVVEKVDKETGCRRSTETIKYKDAKLWPGGSQSWDWKKHGTSHRRGITLEDVIDVYGSGAQTIVLSMGKMSWLHVPHFVINEVENDGHTVIVKPTQVAMEIYNKLAECGHPVAGLFHTTC